MEIKYPVRYDSFNQIIVDSLPRTICLLSWQGLRMEKSNIDKFGLEVAMSMNDAYDRRIKASIDVPVEVPQVEQAKRRGNPNWIKKT